MMGVLQGEREILSLIVRLLERRDKISLAPEQPIRHHGSARLDHGVPTMSQPPPVNRSRETMLAVMLTLSAVVGFVFFLMILTGGWVIYLGMVLLAMVGFGGLHYLLWGRLMMNETVGEREEVELRDQMDLKEWDLPEDKPARHP
jgi:hypothetical protein